MTHTAENCAKFRNYSVSIPVSINWDFLFLKCISYPLQSSAVGIKVLYRPTGSLRVVSVNDTGQKCVLFHHKDSFIAMPLIHYYWLGQEHFIAVLLFADGSILVNICVCFQLIVDTSWHNMPSLSLLAVSLQKLFQSVGSQQRKMCAIGRHLEASYSI